MRWKNTREGMVDDPPRDLIFGGTLRRRLNWFYRMSTIGESSSMRKKETSQLTLRKFDVTLESTSISLRSGLYLERKCKSVSRKFKSYQKHSLSSSKAVKSISKSTIKAVSNGEGRSFERSIVLLSSRVSPDIYRI